MKGKNIISEVARMQSLFGYKRGVVISEQLALQIPGGISQEAYNQIMAMSNLNKGSFRGSYLAPLQQSQIDKVYGQGTYDKFFKNGGQAVLDGKATPQPAQNMGQAIASGVKQFAKTLQQAADKTTKPKVQFVAEKFPLKYMMQGENVKKLQQALGVVNSQGQPNITGKFYTATQKALDAKAQELGLDYDRNVGLTEEDFNQIVNPKQPRQIEKVEPVSTVKDITAVPPAAPTNLTAKPTQIQVNAPQPAAPQLSQQSQQAMSGELTPQQIRQQSRYDQRLARQARRNERRAGRA